MLQSIQNLIDLLFSEIYMIYIGPLVGKHTDVSKNAVSDFGRGSVKLRAQWIYTLVSKHIDE
jgi:hypothetical protein